MACISIKKNTNKVCTGDLDKRIKIQTTSITANNAPGGLSTTGFTDIYTCWALVKTTTTRQFIDGVNIEIALNTDFFIRYTGSVNFEQELWIEYAGNRFKLINYNNIDKDNVIIRLRCSEKGDSAILVNAR